MSNLSEKTLTERVRSTWRARDDSEIARRWLCRLETTEDFFAKMPTIGDDLDTSDDDDSDDPELIESIQAGEEYDCLAKVAESSSLSSSCPTLNSFQRNALGDASLLLKTCLADAFKESPGDIIAGLLCFCAFRWRTSKIHSSAFI